MHLLHLDSRGEDLVQLRRPEGCKGGSSLNAWQLLFGWFEEFGIGGGGR